MNVRILYACVLAGLNLACGGLGRSPENQLAWIDSADPERMFLKDVESGRIRFLAVCGRGCFSPEVDVLTYDRCYLRHAGTRRIDRTGDVIHSGEHGRLKNKAFALASSYNTRALAYLDSLGSRDCPVSAKWDELWRAMITIADSVPKDPYVTSILAYTPREQGVDFQLHVPNRVHLTESLKARLCALVPRFGLDTIRLRVTTGDINDRPHEEHPFACYGASVAA